MISFDMVMSGESRKKAAPHAIVLVLLEPKMLAEQVGRFTRGAGSSVASARYFFQRLRWRRVRRSWLVAILAMSRHTR